MNDTAHIKSALQSSSPVSAMKKLMNVSKLAPENRVMRIADTL
jgi:hypothetical protein